MRINNASDDAAGLSIAMSLGADVRVYSQGTRNLNDGISLLNIADGALANLSSIVSRVQELAEQAANGTLNTKQRQSLDAEAQALSKEYLRIARTTDYNGLSLFDGTFRNVSIQGGYGASGSVCSTLGGAIANGTFSAPAIVAGSPDTASSYGAANGDINGDGNVDFVTASLTSGSQGIAEIYFGAGDGTFRLSQSYAQESLDSLDIALGDLNGDGDLDLVTAGRDTSFAGWATVRLGNGDGTFRKKVSYAMENLGSLDLSLADLNGDTILDIATAGQIGGNGATSVRLGKGDGTFGSASSYIEEAGGMYSCSVLTEDLNGDGDLDLVTGGATASFGGRISVRLGNGDGSFGGQAKYDVNGMTRNVSLADLNGDGISDLVASYGNGISPSYVDTRLGNGDGTFRSFSSWAMDTGYPSAYGFTAGDVNGDGKTDLVMAAWDETGSWGQMQTRLGNGDGSFQALISSPYLEEMSPDSLFLVDVNKDGVDDLISTGTTYFGSGIGVRISGTRSGVSPLPRFSLKTQADARQAIPVLKTALDNLSAQRSVVGAFQSRLTTAVATLETARLQSSAAEGRIKDCDMASESAELVRSQILQQGAAAVLTQANQQPALARRLLAT